MATDYEFQPRYILDAEVSTYGLPLPSALPTIMNLIDAASSLIDEHCGRIDGTGAGSLVYSTYTERILLPEGRNIFRVSYTPLVTLSPTISGNLVAQNAVSGDHFYTGFLANVTNPFIAISGRYGYGRRGTQQVYPDLNYGANILQVASFFGGPPQFTVVDVTQIDFDDKTGEVWIPAGLYLSQYTEVVVTYNTGYDPNKMPRGIKHSCAALVKNFLSRGGGTTGMREYSAGKIRALFTEELIDKTIQEWLSPWSKAVGM